MIGDFEGFYRVHRDLVAHALAITLNDRDLGCEAADEAMVRALERWNSVSGYANPAGWVYRVGLNWARTRMRVRRRETLEVAPEPFSVPEEVGDPAVARVLAELPVTHRAVVVLRYFADWTLEEIGEALHIPLGTVKSRLHRAHQRLAKSLEVTR